MKHVIFFVLLLLLLVVGLGMMQSSRRTDASPVVPEKQEKQEGMKLRWGDQKKCSNPAGDWCNSCSRLQDGSIVCQDDSGNPVTTVKSDVPQCNWVKNCSGKLTCTNRC